MGVENQANKEPRAQLHEQNMQIGNRHNQLQMTSEVIEQKFLDGILKLAKEQSDAEDVEIARHREKIIGINTKYQEKLEAVRAHQANRREEFLRKASQARLQQYQQAGTSQFSNTDLIGGPSYCSTAVASSAEGHRPHTAGQFEYLGGGRDQKYDEYPQGRTYNTGIHYYQ
ncbi:Ubiquitin carboxyl-terminal hydrolase [Melia azedarach]|nr:Ubiquitin carboxyl-terminal hydrolase [Melia azedarach]